MVSPTSCSTHPCAAWSARFATLAVLGLLSTAVLGAQEVRPSILLQPDPVGLEEAVVLQIEIKGNRLQGAYFDASFRLENLERLEGPQQSTQLQIVNGVPSTSRTLTWHLRPTAIGRARVYGVEVEVGDQTLKLADQQVMVQAEIPLDRRQGRRRARSPFDDPFFSDPFDRLLGTRRPSRRQQQPRVAPKVFLRAEARPRQPFVGQQTLYTVYLYTQANINSIRHADVPDFKGFWAKEIPQPEQLQPESVEHEGATFGRVVLLQRALFPRRPGTVELPPVETSMVARIQDGGAFGGLFARPQEIHRKSNAVQLEVRPLPPTSLAGFSGAVGQLSLEADLEPRDLEVGEATTLTIDLSGPGHLQGLEPPRLAELEGVKIFPPQQQSSEKLRRKTVHGSRTWSFVLVPERSGEIELPPVEIPYFDPRTETYQMARTAPLSLTVRGASRAQIPEGSASELHPIRTSAVLALQGGNGKSDFSAWLFGLPFALSALLLVVRARRGGSGQARQQMLARLGAVASEERPRQAAALIEEAWRDFLAEQWQIPPGTASTQWSRLLVERGAAAERASELVELADDLHYLRYAPKLSTTSELRTELLERSRKLARSLS